MEQALAGPRLFDQFHPHILVQTAHGANSVSAVYLLISQRWQRTGPVFHAPVLTYTLLKPTDPM